MLRSLYSGISGMKVNQTKLDVLGNNIANVGTTAFKSSRTRFQDMLSQNVTSASSPSLNLGGTNASKVGLGVKLAGIDSMMSQGSMQPTSRNLDAAIDGEGYFMVSKGPVAFESGKISISTDNTLGNTNNNDIFYTRDGAFTLDSDGNLLNSDGLRVLGYSISGMGMPYTKMVDADGDSTTPDVAQTQPGEAVNSSISTSGKIDFVDSDSVDSTTQKSNLKATDGLRTLRIPDKVYAIRHDSTGAMVDKNGAAVTFTDPANPTEAELDSVREERRIISFTIEKNGLVKGVCEGGKVAVLGQIAMASFKNPGGLEKQGGNIYRNSSNSGSPVVRTGVGATANNEAGYGDMLQGMLEMSNVDLAEQFTDMIVASRAFQAAGKMISTGDEILQDIINLKR
jgi:flagellar hook protein FlgE